MPFSRAPADIARSAAESEAPWAWRGITNVFFGDSFSWLRGEMENLDPDARRELGGLGPTTRLTGNGYFRNSISGQMDGAPALTLSTLVSVQAVDSADEGVFGNWRFGPGAPYAQIVCGSASTRSRQPRFFLNTGAASERVFGDSGQFAENTPVIATLTWDGNGDGLVRGYIDGELIATSDGAITGSLPSGFEPLYVGTYYDDGVRRINARFYWAFSVNRCWSQEELKTLSDDPFAPLRRRRILIPVSVGGADITGSGSPQAGDATATGTGERVVTGTATVQAQASTTTGTGERVITDQSSTVQAQPATASGSGTVGDAITGSGSAQAQDATATATGEREITGQGTPQAQAATTTGVGERIITGTAAVQADPANASGTDTEEALKAKLQPGVGYSRFYSYIKG